MLTVPLERLDAAPPSQGYGRRHAGATFGALLILPLLINFVPEPSIRGQNGGN